MNKEKLKKGTFSGVIPMMGLFVMAALMGFQSIPISQSISQELTDSFSDLSRISQTKSHAGFHFYNYIPTGTEYSVNEKSYDLAKEGGNVSWNYNQFDVDTDREDKVESLTEKIVKDNLEPAAGEYLNAKYSSTAGGQNCVTPGINYTAKLLPDAGTDFIEEVDQFPDDIPVTVRSEVEITSTGGWGWFGGVSTAEAAPVEVTCGDNEHGEVKYIGDSSTSTSTLFSDFSSVGYSNELNATANRYHVLAKETTQFYKTLHDSWVGVSSVTKRDNNVCAPSSSDWRSLEKKTVNAVNSDVTTPFNSAKSQVDVSGFSKEFSLTSYTLNLNYDTYSKKFKEKSTNPSTQDVHGCDCHTHEDGDTHCHKTEKDLVYTVTPKEAVASSNVTDTEYKVITEGGWDNIEFLVNSYPHDFENDN